MSRKRNPSVRKEQRLRLREKKKKEVEDAKLAKKASMSTTVEKYPFMDLTLTTPLDPNSPIAEGSLPVSTPGGLPAVLHTDDIPPPELVEQQYRIIQENASKIADVPPTWIRPVASSSHVQGALSQNLNPPSVPNSPIAVLRDQTSNLLAPQQSPAKRPRDDSDGRFIVKIKRKRGRPAKRYGAEAERIAEEAAQAAREAEAARNDPAAQVAVPVKRKVGRPRKHPIVPQLETPLAAVAENSLLVAEFAGMGPRTTKRKRGRPRKNPLPSSDVTQLPAMQTNCGQSVYNPPSGDDSSADEPRTPAAKILKTDRLAALNDEMDKDPVVQSQELSSEAGSPPQDFLEGTHFTSLTPSLSRASDVPEDRPEDVSEKVPALVSEVVPEVVLEVVPDDVPVPAQLADAVPEEPSLPAEKPEPLKYSVEKVRSHSGFSTRGPSAKGLDPMAKKSTTKESEALLTVPRLQYSSSSEPDASALQLAAEQAEVDKVAQKTDDKAAVPVESPEIPSEVIWPLKVPHPITYGVNNNLYRQLLNLKEDSPNLQEMLNFWDEIHNFLRARARVMKLYTEEPGPDPNFSILQRIQFMTTRVAVRTMKGKFLRYESWRKNKRERFTGLPILANQPSTWEDIMDFHKKIAEQLKGCAPQFQVASGFLALSPKRPGASEGQSAQQTQQNFDQPKEQDLAPQIKDVGLLASGSKSLAKIASNEDQPLTASEARGLATYPRKKVAAPAVRKPKGDSQQGEGPPVKKTTVARKSALQHLTSRVSDSSAATFSDTSSSGHVTSSTAITTPGGGTEDEGNHVPPPSRNFESKLRQMHSSSAASSAIAKIHTTTTKKEQRAVPVSVKPSRPITSLSLGFNGAHDSPDRPRSDPSRWSNRVPTPPPRGDDKQNVVEQPRQRVVAKLKVQVIEQPRGPAMEEPALQVIEPPSMGVSEEPIMPRVQPRTRPKTRPLGSQNTLAEFLKESKLSDLKAVWAEAGSPTSKIPIEDQIDQLYAQRTALVADLNNVMQESMTSSQSFEARIAALAGSSSTEDMQAMRKIMKERAESHRFFDKQQLEFNDKVLEMDEQIAALEKRREKLEETMVESVETEEEGEDSIFARLQKSAASMNFKIAKTFIEWAVEERSKGAIVPVENPQKKKPLRRRKNW